MDRTSIRFSVGRQIHRDPYPSEVERAKIFGVKSKKLEMPKYDPSKPLNFKFKILEQYLKDYEKAKAEGKLETTSSKSRSEQAEKVSN